MSLWGRMRDAASAVVSSVETRIQRNVYNRRYGVGGADDMVGTTDLRDRFFTKPQLETLYRNFWAAAKVVDLKPDDVFSPGIIWSGENESQVDTMKDEIERLKVLEKIPEAVKAGRLYGTAIAILCPMNGEMEEPLKPDEVQKGDISHILVADRYSLEELTVYGDPRMENFGEPAMYRWNFREVSGSWIDDSPPRFYDNMIDIHASRVLRFDGISPLGDDGWETGAEDRWGVSVLARVVDDIIQDAVQNAALADVVKRAAIPVFKISKYRDFLAKGTTQRGDAAPEAYAKAFSEDLQTKQAVFMDRNDEVDSIKVYAAGVEEIVKSQIDRLAMIEGVPITRFTGESATGLNANGDGDARDWRITVEAYRKRSIEAQWKKLMMIVARNAGLDEPPEWEWGELGEATEEETALVAKTRAETAVMLLNANSIDEGESREYMNKGEGFELKENWEPPELPMPVLPASQQRPPAKKPSRP